MCCKTASGESLGVRTRRGSSGSRCGTVARDRESQLQSFVASKRADVVGHLWAAKGKKKGEERILPDFNLPRPPNLGEIS